MRAGFTDVRRTSDLQPYWSGLRVEINARVTDSHNDNGHTLLDTATSQDFELVFQIPCSATDDSSAGAVCFAATTLDALAGSSKAVKEGSRMVWELGPVQVFDAGPDESAYSPVDNELFATQGLLVP